MKQTLIAMVEDKPGVLNRIASLFRRRNFNIESIVAGHSEIPGVSRIVIVADEHDYYRRNIIYTNLLKLINVISVKDVSSIPSVSREFALIKIKLEDHYSNEINTIINEYRARIVDAAPKSLIIEATGEEQEIQSLIERFEAFGVLEIMRTGKIAMTRGSENHTGLNDPSNNHRSNRNTIKN